jgi:anti-sigma-K factor RskA
MSETRTDPTHDAIREELEAYAFGTADPVRAARVQAHVATCPECAAALRDYREIVRLLPLGLPAARPPAGARARLLMRARGGGEMTAAPPPRPAPRELERSRLASLRLALVAVLLLVLTGVGVAVNEEFGQGQVGYRWSVSMDGTENAPEADGMVVFASGGAQLLVSGLPPLSPDHVYQFWFARPDQYHVSRGVFTVDERGTASLPVEGPPQGQGFNRCGVTEEPAGGSTEPTGPVVLYGDW